MDSEIIYHGLAGGKGFPAAFASTSLRRDYEAWPLFFLPGTLKTARDSASRSARQKKSQLCTSCLLVFQALSWFCMSGYALIDVDCAMFIHLGGPTPPRRLCRKGFLQAEQRGSHRLDSGDPPFYFHLVTCY